MNFWIYDWGFSFPFPVYIYINQFASIQILPKFERVLKKWFKMVACRPVKEYRRNNKKKKNKNDTVNGDGKTPETNDLLKEKIHTKNGWIFVRNNKLGN